MTKTDLILDLAREYNLDISYMAYLNGGPGSGNWGHIGIPGYRGGSQKGSGGIAKRIEDRGRANEAFNKATNKAYALSREIDGEDDSGRASCAYAIADYGKRQYSKQSVDFPEREHHAVIVGKEKDPVGIGYIWHNPNEDYVYIEAIANADIRQSGVGRRVINYAKRLAKEKGLDKLRLEYTDESRAYYKNHGWEFEEDDRHAYYTIRS